MKQQGKVIGAILLIILIALFALLNTTVVPVNFGVAVFTWPLVLIILVAVLAGAVLMFLIGTLTSFKSRRELRAQSDAQLKELSVLTAENKALKRQAGQLAITSEAKVEKTKLEKDDARD